MNCAKKAKDQCQGPKGIFWFKTSVCHFLYNLKRRNSAISRTKKRIFCSLFRIYLKVRDAFALTRDVTKTGNGERGTGNGSLGTSSQR